MDRLIDSVPLGVWGTAFFAAGSWIVYRARKTGRVRGDTGDWSRKDDPEFFWFEVGLATLLACGGLCLILADLSPFF